MVDRYSACVFDVVVTGKAHVDALVEEPLAAVPGVYPSQAEEESGNQ